MLRDASGGLIETDDNRPLPGYAAHGMAIGDSVASLVELCGVELSERGARLRSPQAALPVVIGTSELGCDADGRMKPSFHRDRVAESDLPASLVMTFYDAQRDYQTGQMQASSGRNGARAERVELPAVLGSEQAKTLVEEALARRYRHGNSIRFRLPPSRITLRPGDAIQIGDGAQTWVARSVTVDGLAVEIEADAAPIGVPTLPADPGRPIAQPDKPIGRTELIMFEAPPSAGMLSDFPIAYVAAATSGSWKTVPIELRLGDGSLAPVAIRRQSAAGHALSVLDARSPMIIDELSSVIVRLVDPSAALLNADIDALMTGANLAVLGEELIQFGRAEEIAPGIFRLSRLLRGRRGTEWAAGAHRSGEPFCLIDQSIQPVEAPTGAIGTNLTAIAHGVGDVAPLPEAQRILTGEAMRPPSPCHLKVRRDGTGIRAQWIRRSHLGWDWLNEVGVPDDPFAELYRFTIEGPRGLIGLETAAASIACDLADIPAVSGEEILLTVATAGPRAISYGISATLTL
jgi:hypothetical protein